MVYTLYLSIMGSLVIFISLNHPIGLGLMLILHTLLISISTGLVGGNFWFSYVLLLVFLGGVLVLFIYMTSLASNEQFSMNWGTLWVGVGSAGLVVVGLVMLVCPSLDMASGTDGLTPQMPDGVGLGELMSKAYSDECFKITALLVFYLLYALMVCASVVSMYTGALRNFN